MPFDGKSYNTAHGRIVEVIERPTARDVDALSATYPAFVLDRLGKAGCMTSAIQSIVPGAKICGPAVTVLGADLDVRRMGIDLCKPGDVLVIAADGSTERSCFGESTARKMQARGVAGVVIDGATRDAYLIREIRFPTFVRGVTPRNYTYPLNEAGAVNVAVSCGGVTVHPGDVVFADDDGVVVVPRDSVARLAADVGRAMREEDDRREASLTEPYNVQEKLRARGYVFS